MHLVNQAEEVVLSNDANADALLDPFFTKGKWWPQSHAVT